MSFETIFDSPDITRDYDTEKLIRYESWSPSLQARLKKIENSIGNNQTKVGKRINKIKLTFSDFPPPTPEDKMNMWIDTKYRVLRVFAENNWEFTRCSWYVGTNPVIYTPVTDDDPNPSSSPTQVPTKHKKTLFTYNLSNSSGNLSNSPQTEMVIGTGAKVTVKVTGASTSSVNTNRQLGCVVLIHWSSGSNKESASVKQYEILGNGTVTWNLSSSESFVCEVDTNYNYLDKIRAVSFDPTTDDNASGGTQIGAPFKYQYTKANIDAAGPDNAPIQTPRDYARGTFRLEVTFEQTY